MAEFEDQFEDPFQTTNEEEQVIYVPHTFSCSNFRLAVAHEEMNSRRRNTMEDVHRILPVLDPDLPNYSYIGIYDGHGGRQIADYLENALERTVAQELKQPDSAGIEERLTRAFLITDMESRALNITTSGATAVMALLSNTPGEEGESRRLVVANVGDSRAVLVSTKPAEKEKSSIDLDLEDDDEEGGGKKSGGYGYFAHRLSYDHRADDAVEQKRIAAAGGFVSRNRVLGILAVSRSFGDHGMKDFVTAQPYITVTSLKDHGECPMLILACDGVWDVLTDQEAADLLLERYLKEGPFTDASQFLVNTAIERGSADNVTAVVVFL